MYRVFNSDFSCFLRKISFRKYVLILEKVSQTKHIKKSINYNLLNIFIFSFVPISSTYKLINIDMYFIDYTTLTRVYTTGTSKFMHGTQTQILCGI